MNKKGEKTMTERIDDRGLDVLFREARTHYKWQAKPVSDATLRDSPQRERRLNRTHTGRRLDQRRRFNRRCSTGAAPKSCSLLSERIRTSTNLKQGCSR